MGSESLYEITKYILECDDDEEIRKILTTNKVVMQCIVEESHDSELNNENYIKSVITNFVAKIERIIEKNSRKKFTLLPEGVHCLNEIVFLGKYAQKN